MSSGAQPNFYLWGAWKTRTIKEPFLTKKVGDALKKVVLGEKFIVALKENGTLVSWGQETKYGCLGLGYDTHKKAAIQDVPAPQDIEGIPNPVTDIQMGTDHLVALTTLGEVYCWGRGDSYQLGNNKKEDACTPVKVESLQEQIVQIAVVRNSTFAVSSNGAVYAWGENKDNTLGLEEQTLPYAQTPTRLTLLGEMRIRKIEIIENRTIIAHVAKVSENIWDLTTGAHEEKSDDVEHEIFKGIDEMQKAMENTQEWWNHLLHIKHGQPYVLPQDVPSGVAESVASTAKSKAYVGETIDLQDDLNAPIDKLERAQESLQEVLKSAVSELERTRQLPGTKNVRFILCMFIDECRLRREKVQRTISARKIVDLKRASPDISGYSVIDFGADSNEDVKKIIAVQKELQRMMDRVKIIEPVDVLSSELKSTLIECLENKITLNDTRVELLKAAEGRPSDPILPPLRIIKDRWNSLKQFSLYALYLECEKKKDLEFKSHDDHLSYLVRASNKEIDQLLAIDKDRIISHDTLVPTLCYDLLRENAELRKMANSYQLHVLMLHLGKTISSEIAGLTNEPSGEISP